MMLNLFAIYVVGIRKASIVRVISSCNRYRYCYSGLNYINGMQNLDIINIFPCIHLIIYVLELDNYTTKREYKETSYKLITG
jgi:hypothetical protein